MTEQSIENEIQEKGLNAPRLTPSHIDSVILAEQYDEIIGTTAMEILIKKLEEKYPEAKII